METWKLSGWNMKRFHKRRQVVLPHSIKALSLPQDQPLRLACLVFFILFFITPSFVTHDRCEGTSSPLSSGWRRLMDAFKCAAALLRDLRCVHVPVSQGHSNKEQMCYLETFYLLAVSVPLLFWQYWLSGALCLLHNRLNGKVAYQDLQRTKVSKVPF